MPSGKFYHKQSGRWLNKATQKAFDYDSVNQDSVCFLISFFRWYPDYFLDMLESENADYSLELPQRLILRCFARYKKVDITGSRGLTKTYAVMLSCMIDGVLWPGEIIRYHAAVKTMSAELAAVAFHQIEKNYPALAMHWLVKSETKDTFKIITIYGSELAIGVIQGGNCSQLVAEEIGQETEPKFDFDDFESKVIPTNRQARTVNKINDTTHIDNKIKIITNASTRVNPAYYKYHNGFMREMLHPRAGDKYGTIVLDMSWEIALICNIRSISYMEQLRATLTAEAFLRQMCSTYTGSSENPIVTDENLLKSRKLLAMETQHCGDQEAIYVVSHDVSYENGSGNAKCADVVWKLTRFKTVHKRDKYLKQLVWLEDYAPPKNDYLQALKIKDLWRRFCLDGGQTTYLAIDARAYGKSVIEELMKPTADGSSPLCCYNHLEYTELEQPYALPVIYPIKAGGIGARDSDGDMIRYAQREWEQNNVQMLTSNINDGIEQYKLKHGIKDDTLDASIIVPYKKTDDLVTQIKNLIMDAGGTQPKERRKSKVVQRDMWSAAKYGLHVAQILEALLAKSRNRRKSDWDDSIAMYEEMAKQYAVMGNSGVIIGNSNINNQSGMPDRAQLLGLRRR